jgi:hypothetical protein
MIPTISETWLEICSRNLLGSLIFRRVVFSLSFLFSFKPTPQLVFTADLLPIVERVAKTAHRLFRLARREIDIVLSEVHQESEGHRKVIAFNVLAVQEDEVRLVIQEWIEDERAVVQLAQSLQDFGQGLR